MADCARGSLAVEDFGTVTCSSSEMSQSLSERLHQWSIKVAYWNSTMLGLLPAPYDWDAGTFQYSKLYICYSFLIQGIILLVCPLSTPAFASRDEKKSSFMHGHVLLQMTYYVGKFLRILANIVLCIEIRLKRQKILGLYKRYRVFQLAYENVHCEHCNAKNAMQNDETRRAQINIVFKVVIGYMNIATILIMFILMQKQPGQWYLIMVAINFIQAHLLTEANVLIFIVLTQMHLHFTYINKSLEVLLKEQMPERVIDCCWRLYSMHFECYQLSMKMLKLCRTVTALTLVKVFSTNITMLYHAVLFFNGSIAISHLELLMGRLTFVIFYLDTMLITLGMSNLQESCNRTRTILGNFVEKEQLYRSGKFLRMLNQFHHYLAGHKLNISIFGMFNFNKRMILQYFISALVHLIVMVQFDMKYRAAK